MSRRRPLPVFFIRLILRGRYRLHQGSFHDLDRRGPLDYPAVIMPEGKDRLRSECLLLLASAIWGFAFVAQRIGMRYVGPFTFNAIRFALGSLAIAPFALLRRGREVPAAVSAAEGSSWSSPLLGGAVAGAVIFFGASFQQIGIVYTTAGKAGFITGLYVILVPVLGLALGRKTGRGTWTGALMAAAGLYLLSFEGPLSISGGDLIVLAGTVFWAAHVLLVSVLVRRTSALVLAMIQFAVCSGLSLAAALLFERIDTAGIAGAAYPILYGGLLSVGVAYTLQVIAQRRVPPAHTAVILSLETVFAAVGGWLILEETIPPRGLLGCALMLAGIIVSQIGTIRVRGSVSRSR
jgi:drug/metabolite transporter (DMT)-like permease